MSSPHIMNQAQRGSLAGISSGGTRPTSARAIGLFPSQRLQRAVVLRKGALVDVGRQDVDHVGAGIVGLVAVDALPDLVRAVDPDQVVEVVEAHQPGE
jgi:hypothetical protein